VLSCSHGGNFCSWPEAAINVGYASSANDISTAHRHKCALQNRWRCLSAASASLSQSSASRRHVSSSRGLVACGALRWHSSACSRNCFSCDSGMGSPGRSDPYCINLMTGPMVPWAATLRANETVSLTVPLHIVGPLIAALVLVQCGVT
jgi:hypothetical protein